MLLNAFLAQKKRLLLSLLGLGLLIGALEGLFILAIKSAFANEAVASQVFVNQVFANPGFGWGAWILLLAALVTGRSGIQMAVARLEIKVVNYFSESERKGLLQVTVMHAVPVYRDPWRRALASGLREGLENLSQGILASLRCLSAGAQVLVLVPILFFFSWKMAAMALLLAIPALWVSRWRTRTLAKTGMNWETSQVELSQAVERFAEGAESQVGNGRIDTALAGMERSLAQHATISGQWEMSKAILPPALEWFFFMVLAGLALLAKTQIGGETDSGYLGLLPFAALLLLLYKPIREWARYYPVSHLGDLAWRNLGNLKQKVQAYPLRKTFNRGEELTIQIREVGFGYQATPMEKATHPVYENLNLDLNPHEITWITGRNGAGKSTLLKILAGIEVAQKGEIRFPDALLAWPRPIGYLSQRAIIESDWLPWYREFTLTSPAIVKELNAILGLERILGNLSGPAGLLNLSGLSGGERQRLCLARAFGSPCGYLLLDEPTTWLSARDRECILGDLFALWRSNPISPKLDGTGPRGACIVSHEPFLRDYCTRIIHLDAFTPALPVSVYPT